MPSSPPGRDRPALFGGGPQRAAGASEGRPIAYLSGVQLGRTLGIEEVGVLPQFRRMGVARLLLAHALQKKEGAVITVGESNCLPARCTARSSAVRAAPADGAPAWMSDGATRFRRRASRSAAATWSGPRDQPHAPVVACTTVSSGPDVEAIAGLGDRARGGN